MTFPAHVAGDKAAALASANRAPRRDARSWGIVALWVIVAFALRTLLSALVPLIPDETYYWEWTRRLSAGYFDHPPGIAYLIRVGTWVGGDTKAGIRLAPALAALLTHLSMVLLCWQLGGKGQQGAQAAARAAALVALIPLATLGLVLATPDAALFLTGILALCGVERALSSPVRSARSTLWWCATGIALGAAFLSKYTAVLLPASLVVACLLHPALRARFSEPGPWLASIIALGMFAPVVAWNRAHDWVSFRFQLAHGFRPSAVNEGVVRATLKMLSRELELIGGQVGLASPVLFFLLAAAVASGLMAGWRERRRAWPTDPSARRFAFAVIAVVPILFFIYSASRHSVEANWPALIYPGAIALLATTGERWATKRAWTTGLCIAAILLGIVTVQALRPVLPLSPRQDPIARAHGWERVALAAASSAPAAVPAAAPTTTTTASASATTTTTISTTPSTTPSTTAASPRIWYAADRYQDASELAFHLPGQPSVFALNLGGRPNQYDLWPTAAERVRPGDAMVVVLDASEGGDAVARRLSQWFEQTARGPVVALTRDGREIATRTIWVFRQARTIPPRDAPAPQP